MTNDGRSDDRGAADINRRGFLTRVAGSALVVGAASPALDLLAAFPEPAATPGSVFRPGFAESDAAVFAEARKHFLIPKGVTYCNTGTLGASPREVVDALVNGTRALETRLAGVAVHCSRRASRSPDTSRRSSCAPPWARSSTRSRTRWRSRRTRR